VKGVRDRHNGLQRNPWNEVECGHHYARAMASWSVLLALSGFEYDGVKKHIGFAPRYQPENFKSFFSTGSAWGTFAQRQDGEKQVAKLEVLCGELTLNTLSLAHEASSPDRVSAKLSAISVNPRVEIRDAKILLTFPGGVKVRTGAELDIVF
jgi:hypothetical protein